MSDDVNNEPISTLIGKFSRVYRTGDVLIEDFRPERVNIELSESGEIMNIWKG